MSALLRVRAGSGYLDILLRVPRAARSSFTCAKRPGNPIPGFWRSYVQVALFPSQQRARCVCRSEVKEEPEGRGT